MQVKHIDRATLRNLLMNTLYYFNSDEKVEAMSSKLMNMKGSKKPDDATKHEGSHHSESINSMADELTAAKTLQAIDDNTYTIHFVLQQLKRGSVDLVELFEGSAYEEPEEEVKRVKLYIYNLLRLYTRALEGVDQEKLRNHISYWLLVSTLIEQQMIEEID